MSYYNLVKRNLNFFFNNLSEPKDEIENSNLEGGVKKKKKFNVLDFDINDLEFADEEIFTNSRSVNPFLKKKTEDELAEQIKDDEDGKPINDDEDNITENELNETNNDLNEIKTKIDKDESNETSENIEEDSNELIGDDELQNFEDDSESEDNSDDDLDNTYLKEYFNNSVTFGGRNISVIKDELGSDKDIEEYTKNVSGGLTGGNIKPIKKYNHKLYPYNLN